METDMERQPKRMKMSGDQMNLSLDYHASNYHFDDVAPNTTLRSDGTKPKSKARSAKRRVHWDVAGRYTLQCTSRYQPVDASQYWLDLYYENDSPHTCMLFAFFHFPNLGLADGVMRLCPRQALDESEKQGWQRLYTYDFDAACELASDIRPGPKSKEWLMRWRASRRQEEDESTVRAVGGYERAQGQFFFKRDAGSGTIHVTFPIVHEGRHLLFEGVKSTEPPEIRSLYVAGKAKSEWARLFDPEWEYRPLSDTEIEALTLDDCPASKGHNHWERPRTGAVIYAKNKPGPNPGFRANEDMSSKVIEERLSWAWDVTGEWTIQSPEFEAIVNGPRLSSPSEASTSPFRMTIWLENNPWHTKVGRQFWAEFEFGGTRGNMRLCPSFVVDELSRSGQRDIQSFEDGCTLSAGVWPGPPESGGTIEWGLKWRGYNDCMGLLDGDSGEATTLRFRQMPDGRLALSGTLTYDSQQIIFTGEKISYEGAERSGQAVTVTRAWKRYEPRAISLIEYLTFDPPE